MKILITTPTGNLGSRVLRELLSQPYDLRVIARRPEKLSPTLQDRIEIFQGSQDDPAALQAALDGVDALFWCQPDSITTDDVIGFYRHFASVARHAIKQAGTAHVVAISAAGENVTASAGPISGLRAMEEELSQCGAAVRFLRCGSFFENFLWQSESLKAEGSFYYPMPGHLAHPMIASDDIARNAADWLNRSDWTCVAPTDLPGWGLSYDEAARTLSDVLGREIRYVALSREDYVPALLSTGYREPAAHGLVDMFEAIARQPWKGQSASDLLPLKNWAEQTLRPALA